MKKHILLMQMLAAAALVSCNDDINKATAVSEAQGEMITEIRASVAPLTFKDGTKSQITPEGNFKWITGDEIGFWPIQSEVKAGTTPRQMMFTVVNGGGSTASFTGNGWGLIAGRTYFAYYPFGSNNLYNEVTISYEGQRQDANNSKAGLGAFDFLNGNVNRIEPQQGEEQDAEGGEVKKKYGVEFYHLGCAVKLSLTIPAHYSGGNFTDLTLSAEDDIFVKGLTYNPAQNAVDPRQASRTMTNEMTVNLGAEGGSGIQCDGVNLTVYAMMSPADIAGKTITATVSDNGGRKFAGTFAPDENQEEGGAYTYSSTLDITEGAAIDLSKLETANCYIVSAAGNYKFKPTEGNSAKTVVPASVSVLWETANTTVAPAIGSYIPAANLEYDSRDGYIYFTATGNKGNAVIAAKDAGGTIIWSWHIWFTDQPADHTYPNEAGILMDRNLGATATTGFLSAGMLYQYARKDPFPGPHSLELRPRMEFHGNIVKTNPDYFTGNLNGEYKMVVKNINGIDNSVEYSVQNPHIFMANIASNQVLNNNDPDNHFSWYGGNGVKTKHDPCPPGYRVADGWKVENDAVVKDASTDFWFKAFGVVSPSWGGSYVYNYSSNTRSLIYTAGINACYPMAGHITGGGVYQWGGLGCFVYANTPQYLVASLTANDTYQPSAITVGNGAAELATPLSTRSEAGSIRCQKMNQSNLTSSQANENFTNSPTSAW